MSETVISVMDKIKMKQKEIVLMGIRQAKETHKEGISPMQLSIILDLPDPTVRKFLGQYVKEGLVKRKMIKSNRSLYWSLF